MSGQFLVSSTYIIKQISVFQLSDSEWIMCVKHINNTSRLLNGMSLSTCYVVFGLKCEVQPVFSASKWGHSFLFHREEKHPSLSIHWFRFHSEGPGVSPVWCCSAHQRGHLPLQRTAVFWLVRGGLSADRTTGPDQTSPQDDSCQE